jgi:hypothetical protein
MWGQNLPPWLQQPSIAETEPYTEARRLQEQAIIRDLLPPGVSPETPPLRLGGSQPQPRYAAPPGPAGPMSRQVPLRREDLLRRWLTTGL